MGVLGVTGSGDGEQHIDPPTGETAEAPEQPRDEAGQFVPAEKLKPETQESRRERQWRERVENYVKPIKDEWATKEQTYQQQIEEERRARQEQAQVLARLQGAIETMQRMPQQRQEAAPQLPDPDRLQAEADAALQANDLPTYHRKVREVARAEAMIVAANERKQLQQDFERRIPPQVPPHIQQLMMAHPNVMGAGDKGIRAVIRAEQELEDDGVPAGYERTKQAFAKANAKFAPKTAPQRPGYSTESREALAGLPTGRTASSSAPSGEGVRLTEAQKDAMKAGGFKSAEEYIKWSDPFKYGLVK